MTGRAVSIPCPFCGDDVHIVLGPDAFVGEAWWGRCECGASYSCGPDGSPGFGHWDRCDESPIRLCPACIGSIGGAHGGPDAPYRPASEGEPCGAADCQGAPDDDDDEPDAYEVWNATGSFPK